MGVKVVLHSFHRAVKHEVPFKIFFYALSFYNDAVINTNLFREYVSRFDNFWANGLWKQVKKRLGVFYLTKEKKEEKTQIKEELLEKTQCINNTL